MDQMLRGLDGTVCYLDDIIVTGRTTQEHLANLEHVFERIEQYGFHINRNKCLFLQDSIEYLGFLVDKTRCSRLPVQNTSHCQHARTQQRLAIASVSRHGQSLREVHPEIDRQIAPAVRLVENEHSVVVEQGLCELVQEYQTTIDIAVSVNTLRSDAATHIGCGRFQLWSRSGDLSSVSRWYRTSNRAYVQDVDTDGKSVRADREGSPGSDLPAYRNSINFFAAASSPSSPITSH